MREIKFRAWSDRLKEWLNVNSHYWLLDPDDGSVIGVHHSGQVESELPNIVLMQYTGLHDKNGKEIYEGDICWFGPEDKSTFSVIWETNGWHKSYRGWDDNLPNPIFDERELFMIEVIGNIYENPELLGITEDTRARDV